MTGLAPKDDTPGLADFTSQISEKLKLAYSCISGSFGIVHQCTIETSEGAVEVAVKALKVDPGRTIEKNENAMRRELMVWLRLKHRTIVPLLGIALVESPFPALISQWMPSGTLYVYLKEATGLTASTKVELVKGVVDGLQYLHSENVIHGDLHPANVLIDCSGIPRLTDFGLATVVGDAELQLSITTATRSLDPRWRAPEVIGIDCDPGRPTFMSDIYSFGGIMFFVISGDIPWKEKKQSHQICIELSKRAKIARPGNVLDNHWDLIQTCWSWDPEDRPAAIDLFKSLPQAGDPYSESGINVTALVEPYRHQQSVSQKVDCGLVDECVMQNGRRHLLSVYECQWDKNHTPCGMHIEGDQANVTDHLARFHGFTGGEGETTCLWDGCTSKKRATMKGTSVARHLVTHIGYKIKCATCNVHYAREDACRRSHANARSDCQRIQVAPVHGTGVITLKV